MAAPPPPPTPQRRRAVRLCSSLVADVRARAPLYASDYTDGFRASHKVLAATVFIFLANALPALTFAAFLSSRTGGAMGVPEVLLAMGGGGALYALLAGNGMVVIGVTGPVCLLLGTMHDVCVSFGLPFLGWLFWVGAWACAMHLALSALGASRAFPRLVTAFSGEVFGGLISVIYIYEGVRMLVELTDDAALPLTAGLLSLLLGLGCFWCAGALSGARAWPVLPRALRTVAADYGMAASVALFTCAQFLPRVRDVALPCLAVPATLAPSLPGGRPWLDASAIRAVPAWGVFAALLPAAVLVALLYFDQNVSALLSQQPHFRLRKPPAWDWDFAVEGCVVLLCTLFGLPPPYALIPQAPLHVRALAHIRDEGDDDDGEVDGRGGNGSDDRTSDDAGGKRAAKRAAGPLQREVWTGVVETRVSALVSSLLMLVLLTQPLLRALAAIPKGVLAGLFLHLGVAGLHGNALAERLLFLAMPPAERARVATPWAAAPLGPLARFTLLQLLLTGAILGVTFTPAGLAFPVLILVLVPLRIYVLPRLFTPAQLRVLDPRDDGGSSSSSGGDAGNGGAAARAEGAASPAAPLHVGRPDERSQLTGVYAPTPAAVDAP